MFTIEPKFLTLIQLLEKRLFRIPLYQRAYSWQSKQRNDMFNDIRKLQGKARVSHFMATVVGVRNESDIVEIGTDEYTVIDIVDGQQRLTTLVILLKVIMEELALLLKDVKTHVDDEIRTIPKAQLERELRELQELLIIVKPVINYTLL